MKPVRNIDPVTLDRMVTGTDSPEDADAWTALVSMPNAAARWDQAVADRKRVDDLARLVQGHPFLASLLLGVRRAGRRMGMLDLPLLDVQAGPDLVAATLGEPVPQAVPLEWGQVRVLEVAIGEVVTIHRPSGTRLLFSYHRGEDELPSGRWRMEAGDAPVFVMVSMEEEEAPTNLAEILRCGGPVAGLVLVERRNGENEE